MALRHCGRLSLSETSGMTDLRLWHCVAWSTVVVMIMTDGPRKGPCIGARVRHSWRAGITLLRQPMSDDRAGRTMI